MPISIGSVVRIGIFLVGSYGIVRLSLPSLRDPRSHGFYRFFAFESLLALLLMNIPAWFHNPISPSQLMSWILLMASAILAIHGFAILRGRGRPSASFETTTVLVTSGLYRYIRHPLYASLLYFGWGVFLKQPLPIPAVLTAAASVMLFLTARSEERENLSKFGADYADYIKKPRRFIPFIF